MPRRHRAALWTEDWMAPEQCVAGIDKTLRDERAIVLCGDEFARWDLEVRGGMFGGARLLLAVEDHGAGAQYVRTRIWPCFRRGAEILLAALAILTTAAALASAWLAAAVFTLGFTLLAICTFRQSGSATAALLHATAGLRPEKK